MGLVFIALLHQCNKCLLQSIPGLNRFVYIYHIYLLCQTFVVALLNCRRNISIHLRGIHWFKQFSSEEKIESFLCQRLILQSASVFASLRGSWEYSVFCMIRSTNEYSWHITQWSKSSLEIGVTGLKRSYFITKIPVQKQKIQKHHLS